MNIVIISKMSSKSLVISTLENIVIYCKDSKIKQKTHPYLLSGHW